MTRRAFSLVEVIVSIALITLVAFVSFGTLGRSRGQAGAQGLSLAFADVFRQARQEALSRRRPVAVMLPSSSGSLPNVASYYILEGETLPQITRVRSYATEYRTAQAFVGTWPLNAASASTLTTTLTMPGSKWANFNITSWLPPASAQDYAFCYLPDGTLRTNGLKLFDNSYHVAVCSGVAFSGSSGNFQLTRAGSSFTLVLSPAGSVTVDSGLTGQSGAIDTSTNFLPPTAATPPNTTSVVHQNPVMVGEPKIFPPPDPDLLPPGINATLTREQFLSLETTAKSPSGEPLFCNWQVVAPVPTAGQGSYSFQGSGGRMVWDPQADSGNGAWKAIWQWRPPPAALPNDVYRLQCVVQNYGGAPLAAQIKEVKVVPPGNIFFETNRSGTPEIWSMNEDGSRQQVYVTGASQPTADLDGNRVAYIRGGNIYLKHPAHPGTEMQLTSNGGYSIPCLSPNGTKLAFRYGANEVHVMRVSDTGNSTNITVDSSADPPDSIWIRAGTDRLAWSPDGRHLMYTRHSGNVAKADIGDGAGGNPTLIGGPSDFLTSQPSGENPIWNAAWGVNNHIYWSINKTSPADLYDPYLFYANYGGGTVTHWDWGRDSYNLEEIMSTPDPAGGDWIMAIEQTVPSGIDQTQIVKVNTNVPMGFSLGPAPRIPLTATPGAYNTRPCWTK